MDKVYFDKVAIIGVGLIGGSFGLAIKERGLCGTITGIGRSEENLATAVTMGIADSTSTSIAEGVKGADLVFVAVPVLKTKGVIEEALPHLKDGALITDGGSVKEALALEVDDLLRDNGRGIRFVPGHPIAGTEESGAGAAFLGLYEGKRCILTPTESTDGEALESVKRLWELVGSEAVIMDASEHDRVVAAISHLPHMIAYSLVNTVAGLDGGGDGGIISYSAGGFKDFTRIASSSPEMWAHICSMNGAAILEMIEAFQSNLSTLKDHIESGDLDSLQGDFEVAKRARDSV